MSAKILRKKQWRKELKSKRTVENKQEDGKRFEMFEMNGKGKI